MYVSNFDQIFLGIILICAMNMVTSQPRRRREGGREGAPAAGSECTPKTHGTDLERKKHKRKDEECMHVLSNATGFQLLIDT